eukprot:4540815-Alexandrium_andersonii.AAC.1
MIGTLGGLFNASTTGNSQPWVAAPRLSEAVLAWYGWPPGQLLVSPALRQQPDGRTLESSASSPRAPA